MKIAITSDGTALEAAVSLRFGRAAYFILFDTDSDTWECHANSQDCKSLQRAGVRAAELARQLGASAVISGHIGPRARRMLYENNIKFFKPATHKVQETIDAFKRGELPELEIFDPEGLWKVTR